MQVTDRELLEKAAKAEGMDISGWHWSDRAGHIGAFRCRVNGEWVEWNPLTDDGDALRLAVSLKLDVCQQEAAWATSAGAVVIAASGESAFVKDDGDPCAATRRAIVRAAAALADR